MEMKKILGTVLVAVLLVQGIQIGHAADYADKSFSFCCQQSVYETPRYTKGVKGYVYFKYMSGQPAIYVNVLNGSTGAVGNKKYINNHVGYALANSVSAGHKVYLRLSAQSKDNTYDKGVWSPDCAGSYPVK